MLTDRHVPRARDHVSLCDSVDLFFISFTGASICSVRESLHNTCLDKKYFKIRISRPRVKLSALRIQPEGGARERPSEQCRTPQSSLIRHLFRQLPSAFSPVTARPPRRPQSAPLHRRIRAASAPRDGEECNRRCTTPEHQGTGSSLPNGGGVEQCTKAPASPWTSPGELGRGTRPSQQSNDWV